MITCVVGSGGKTTLIHKLANDYLQQGKRVLITTTTHMYQEPDTLVTDNPAEILECLKQNGIAFAGTRCSEPDKIGPLSAETLETVCNYADEVLIEADGSRQLPLKFPNATEPVLSPSCQRIIVVTSLLALGRPAKETVHRLPLALPLLDITEDTPITAEHIQTLLRKGYLEPLKNQTTKLEIQVTQDGSLYQRALAALLAADMDVSVLDPDWFREKPRLFICGAGHVAKELADIAAHLDFRVQVMDRREEFANKERFPHAERIICAPFEELTTHLEKDSFYAVVTPGHQDDYACVKQIINSSYAYLGMIGSRKKIETTYQTLLADGFSQEQLNTIHAPIGLSIGAITPGEIAISILAQMIEIKNQRSTASASAELLNTKEHGTLCIIIDKKGSTPRGKGSMMFVTDHSQIDSLGGGAIEHQAILDAKTVTAPCIKEYCLNASDSAKLGMICGGTNKVLFIPLH